LDDSLKIGLVRKKSLTDETNPTRKMLDK